MRYVIVDLEATCWPEGNLPERMEITEIGAVMMETAAGPISSEFDEFVKPLREPILSDFCTELTSIRQEDVDAADTFGLVFPRFVHWIGDGPFRICSWGGYDLKQFRVDCGRFGIPMPASFEAHINIKKEFVRQRGVKPMGLKGALEMLKIPFAGRHHRGIDDARMIAKIAALVLPGVEAAESAR